MFDDMKINLIHMLFTLQLLIIKKNEKVVANLKIFLYKFSPVYFIYKSFTRCSHTSYFWINIFLTIFFSKILFPFFSYFNISFKMLDRKMFTCCCFYIIFHAKKKYRNLYKKRYVDKEIYISLYFILKIYWLLSNIQ